MAEKIKWYHSPIDRNTMRELTKRRNLPGLVQSIGMLLVYASTISLSLYFFHMRMWALMIIACYVHSMFHGFIGMEASVHELSHGTAFKTKWLNEFFYRFFSFLSWNNPIHFRYSHTGHHLLTVHRGLDKEVVLEPHPLNFKTYLQWFTFDWKKFKMIMIPNIAHFFGRGDVDVFFWDPLFEKDDPRRKQMIRWARFMVVGHIVLLIIFIYFRLWVLIYLVTFGYWFADFLARGCGMQQHIGLSPNVPDWRLSCHTMKFGPIMSFLYWNMNYHIEHHMYAAVPFFNLKRLHSHLKNDMPVPVRGFMGGVRKIMSIQKKQRKTEGYLYIPEFPDSANPPQFS
jgi:fatty acid desaturase